MTADPRAASGPSDASQDDQGRGGSGGRSHTSPLEWVAAAISSLLVLGLLAFLFYEALNRTHAPPSIVIRADSVVSTAGGYLVLITARNVGDATAVSLAVEGALKRGTATVEQSTATIDFVPIRSERRAGLVFSRDPRQHALELRALGFNLP